MWIYQSEIWLRENSLNGSAELIHFSKIAHQPLPSAEWSFIHCLPSAHCYIENIILDLHRHLREFHGNAIKFIIFRSVLDLSSGGKQTRVGSHEGWNTCTYFSTMLQQAASCDELIDNYKLDFLSEFSTS